MEMSVLLAAFLALAPAVTAVSAVNDEPLIDHQPVECTVPEKNARICAYVLDDGEVKRVRVYFRSQNQDAYYWSEILDFSFERFLRSNREQRARHLLRDGAGAIHALLEDVGDGRDENSRDAQTEVAVEARIFRSDDRVTKYRSDTVVVDKDAALDRKIADEPAAAGVNACDRAGFVVVEGGNMREVSTVREEYSARQACECHTGEQSYPAGPRSQVAGTTGKDTLHRVLL